MIKNICNKIFAVILITSMHCCTYINCCTGNRPDGNETSDISRLHTLMILAFTNTCERELKTFCQQHNLKPLFTAADYNHPEYIEPLVRFNFDVNETTYDFSDITPLCDALHCDRNQYRSLKKDTIKELVRYGADYHHEKFFDAIFNTCDSFRNLRGITEQKLMLLFHPDACDQWFINEPVLTEALKDPLVKLLQHASTPGWKTKTWRRMSLAFLMASHTRTGHKSAALSLCQCHLLFRTIADMVPTHMSMEDRWARRERKGHMGE